MRMLDLARKGLYKIIEAWLGIFHGGPMSRTTKSKGSRSYPLILRCPQFFLEVCLLAHLLVRGLWWLASVLLTLVE